ncbi:MAG TPA: methylated-DNA--[protein]-cysteine S-methyltransferase [Actinomycetota bacterium]|nr:methylated-DNA--[protein]-cysteine S-methyltransferase [Actinomycetota bacterium]
MLRFTAAPTPFGEMTIVATDRGLIRTILADDPAVELEQLMEARAERARRDDRGLAPFRRELRAYFDGRIRAFTTQVDLSFAGNGFSRRAVEAAMRVPYGVLRTYGDLAAEAGSPRAWRAAGRAMRTCPVELWVPCHRIVPAGPGLGRYGGHPERREFLLRLERAI